MSKLSRLAILLAALVAAVRPASAQKSCRATVVALSDPSARAQIAAIAEHAISVADVMGEGSVCGHGDSLSGHGWRSHVGEVQPILRLQYDRGVPDGRQNGGAWAGLGFNGFVRAGVTFDARWLHAVVAPQAWYAQNERFAFYPGADASRSGFASMWYTSPYSLDLPTRWGARGVQHVDLGQSAIWAAIKGVDIGLSNASVSWGPGVRGHLLLGPDAPGIPRAFLRTNRPIDTPFGSWSGSVFLGTLTESPFFDTVASNDLRTLTAWHLAWQPSNTSHTVIGVEHLGMRMGSPFGTTLQRPTGPTDQLNAIYARASAPVTGLRAYVEIGRAGALPSLRQFLEIPYQGITYLFGAQQAIRTAPGTLLLTGEIADLEQPTDIRGQRTQDFYTSNDIPQGWTQRGQLLGDGIGPGGQSQWLSLDWVTATRSAGVFAERVRWNEDAFLRQYIPFLLRHDVTLRVGVRGEMGVMGRRMNIEISSGRRLNYLFQNGTGIPGLNTTDVAVTEVKVSITPFRSRRP